MNYAEYLLKLLDWQLFFTLTWRDVYRRSCQKREADVNEFLARYAAREEVSLADLPMVIRWERGEQTQRPHCHVLLTGFPNPASYAQGKRHALMAIWNRHHGLARVRRWRSDLRAEAASYLTVGMDGCEREVKRVSGRFTDGNEYEIVKCDRAERLVFSGALWRELQRLTQTTFEVLPTT